MLRSLYSGVAGLKSFEAQMDNIGNNIANVNTTAYKAKSTAFSTLLSQTVKEAQAANNNRQGTNAKQIGLGTKVMSVTTNITAGGPAQLTGKALDFQINGNAFFVVNTGDEIRYTRDGSFNVDVNGDLVMNGTGYYVYGWTSQDGKTVEVTDDLTSLGRLNVLSEEYLENPGEQTTNLTISGNIDGSDRQLETDGRTFSITIYDARGEEYSLVMQVQKPEGAEDGNYELTIKSVTDSEGRAVELADNEPVQLVYDTSTGRFISANGNEDGLVALNLPGAMSGDGEIVLDLSSTTGLGSESGSSRLTAGRGDTAGEGAGKAIGKQNGISVDEAGRIYVTYSNNSQRLVGQIAMAKFRNPSGLGNVGDNTYTDTENTGGVSVVTATEDGGSLVSGTLEMSNVALSEELTNMIIAQRSFQANSKIISTSDEMLQVAKDLKK